MKSYRSAIFCCVFAIMFGLVDRVAHAHPMGNFSINHYSRIEIHKSAIAIRYIIDMAEIPTVSERAAMDANEDGKISDAERMQYLASAAVRLRSGITLSLNGNRVVPAVKPIGLEFLPGAGGLLTTRITLDLVTIVPREIRDETVEFVDGNYDARTGWKEIVLAPDTGFMVTASNASQTDLSRQLTAYPVDATIAPPQQTEAHFVITTAEVGGNSSLSQIGTSANATDTKRIPRMSTGIAVRGSITPRDGFTQAIARGNLTTGLILLCLATAFGFGALHALSPGHGKAMMAAYLVGARGTARHAVLLGLVVTITHTIGVFALGLIMLFAAQYVVPERLYPALSALSGLTIAVMGAVLLRQRWVGLTSAGAAEEAASDNTAYDNIPLSDPNTIHHSGNSVRLTPAKTDPLSVRSLVALGITGGILPCPSALVVMLSAVALHRVAFGMVLIIAFSAGLAVVLTGIGVCVVYMRALTDRIPTRGKLLQRLPTMSAAFVMLIGLFLIFKSVRGAGY